MRNEKIKSEAQIRYGITKQAAAFITGVDWADSNPTHEDFNNLARRAYGNAILRGKTNKTLSHIDSFFSIFEELKELRNADERCESAHIPGYTEAAEELADILIACLTELHSRGVDIDRIVKDKINFNETRI